MSLQIGDKVTRLGSILDGIVGEVVEIADSRARVLWPASDFSPARRSWLALNAEGKRWKVVEPEAWTNVPLSDLGPMVYGNGLTHLARMAFERAALTPGQIELIEASIGCMPRSMSGRHWLAVATKKADLEGDDQQGFRWVQREDEDSGREGVRS